MKNERSQSKWMTSHTSCRSSLIARESDSLSKSEADSLVTSGLRKLFKYQGFIIYCFFCYYSFLYHMFYEYSATGYAELKILYLGGINLIVKTDLMFSTSKIQLRNLRPLLCWSYYYYFYYKFRLQARDNSTKARESREALRKAKNINKKFDKTVKSWRNIELAAIKRLKG